MCVKTKKMEEWRKRNTLKKKAQKTLSDTKHSPKELKHLQSYIDQFKREKKLWEESKIAEASSLSLSTSFTLNDTEKGQS